MLRSGFFAVLLLLLAACNAAVERPAAATPIPIESIPTVHPNNTRLAQAQHNYNLYCAHCHGYGGEGQPAETVEQTLASGYHTVPLHNAAGHTWQHPDQILFQTIKFGVQAPVMLYTMEGFDTQLEDDEIFAIIDYIRRWWTEDQRNWQAALTQKFAENTPFWEETYLDAQNTP